MAILIVTWTTRIEAGSQRTGGVTTPTVSTIVLSVTRTIVVTVGVVTAVGFILVISMTIGTGI
jgi:hypothetical protein